jgi:hypothetical protein
LSNLLFWHYDYLCARFFLTLSPVLLAKLFDLLLSQENPLNKWIVPGCLELPCQMIEMNVHRKENDFCGLLHVVLFLFFLIIVPCHHQLSSKIIMQIHYEHIWAQEDHLLNFVNDTQYETLCGTTHMVLWQELVDSWAKLSGIN